MRVAILGGGVAGVSAAIALKAKGFEVTVYERHHSETTMGAGIVIWPNAAYVLDQLGLLDDMRSVSGCPSHMHRLSSRGEKLGSLDIKLINKAMGYPSLSILRKDFQRLLIARLESLNIPLKYGYSVTQLETKKAKVEVYFSHQKRITADIIIGADGRMNSLARQYVLGNNTPKYQGFINWVGVFEAESPIFKEIAVEDYWGVGERFGIVPISSNKAYWAGGVASSTIAINDPDKYKQELKKIFSGWPKVVQMLIEKTPQKHINKIYVHDHDPITTWHKNNLILIGDAAHAPLPTSGQGACQALEDAWHLARCLADNDVDLETAFSDFTTMRYDKTAGIIASGRSLAASLFNSDAAFCRQRNENSINTDYSSVAKAMAQGWGSGLVF